MKRMVRATSDKLPINLTHNNDMLDDKVLPRCHPRCAACFCSMVFLLPAVYTFIKYAVLIGKIQGTQISMDEYQPWTPADLGYYKGFEDEQFQDDYDERYTNYNDEGLTRD